VRHCPSNEQKQSKLILFFASLPGLTIIKLEIRRVIFVRFCPAVKMGREFFDPDQNTNNDTKN